MQLNQQIAQKIVQRTMKIIGYSVNVMNEVGVIIASGDPSRLQQSHIGAIIALRQNCMVEIDDELAKKWHNQVKPGINLPISYLDQLIGVIGISGEPDKVRNYVQLVKMATELIIEQADALEQEKWHKRYKEEFIVQLLTSQIPEETQKLAEKASMFSFDAKLKHRVLLIKLLNPNLENLQQLINKIEQQPHLHCAVIGLEQVAIIQALQTTSATNPNNLKPLLMQTHKTSQYKIGIGITIDKLIELPISYKTAQNILDYGLKMFPKQNLYFFEQHSLSALLFNLSASWLFPQIIRPLKQLEQQDHKKVLIKTLQQYFLSNCELDRTAKQLAIHPNTLRYRLTQIEQITTLKINKIDDLFSLYLASILY